MLLKLWGVRLWDIKRSSCSCPQCQGRFSQRCFCMNPLCHVKQAALTIPLFEEPFWISLLGGSKSWHFFFKHVHTKIPRATLRSRVDVRWCTILIYTSKHHHRCRERQWKISKDLKHNSKSIRQWLPWAMGHNNRNPLTRHCFCPKTLTWSDRTPKDRQSAPCARWGHSVCQADGALPGRNRKGNRTWGDPMWSLWISEHLRKK